MSTWLDSRASQNASYGSSIAIPIPTSGSLQLVAQQTLNLALGTPGNTRVEFAGTVTFQQPSTPVDAMVTIYVMRGLTSGGVVVFSLSEQILAAQTGPRAVSFNGSDFGAPVSASAAYSVFATSSLAGMLRVGPESFNFSGYSN
ncbi:hypothetical protein [Paenibacillus herberti]|uniref:Uncharacterized protein n=1 Tax=Paenibacillus herberti TaxID=1619309 RepID=A0A229NY62_9BACL|nr:hypothetical protein [Paenibacillus herberti]OXM14691.1 hypothetical protein CGZ75_17470 [Paenibacillus herberti]